MRKALRRQVPSMFHRRLLLLAAVMLLVVAVLGLQTARLAVGEEHRERRLRAENALLTERPIPTVRGHILDRKGRVLAHDEPGFAVVVDYDVITGDWAYNQAYREAKRAHRETWGEMDRTEREALVAELQPKYDEQAEMLWSVLAEVGAIERERIEARRATIIRRVQQIGAGHTRRRQARMAADLEEPVAWADAVESVQEETWKHAILGDVGDATRGLIAGFIAEAEAEEVRETQRRLEEGGDYVSQQALKVWLEVELLRPKQRRYPFETQTVVVPTDSLPSVLRDRFEAQPREMAAEGVGLHLLGLMRDIWAEDESRRPFHKARDRGGYLAGDRAGGSGVEAVFEDVLRGVRGWQVTHLDTGAKDITAPVPGQDVTLSIDIALQARIQALMDPSIGLMQSQPWHSREEDHQAKVGQPLNGAAVVLDIETGEVLAAVSKPDLPLRELRENARSIYQNQYDQPFLNRPFVVAYQPGSTVKPLVLAAAYTDRKIGLDEIVDVRGYLWPNKPTVYRDWIFKQTLTPFGPIDGVFAIKRSSNVFFGMMQQRMGLKRLTWWYEQFGLGRPTGVGVKGESSGRVLDRTGPILPADEAFTAIGQGPIAWTVIQGAAAHAVLAREGWYLPPTIVRGGNAGRGRDLNLSSRGLTRVLEGMRLSASDSLGTTHHLSMLNREPIFNAEGVTVMAKSGTAQAAPLKEVVRYDEQGYPAEWGRVLRSGDHAWVIALVQPDGARRPTHVIACVVEYAGSGGQVAGPVVNQIIHALQDEGYLE